jgi:hypothetical protein
VNDSKTAETEPCSYCRTGNHESCTENYCTCDCSAAGGRVVVIDPDPTTAARKIAKVLLGLVEPETAHLLARKAAERGEPWLWDHWREYLADGERESHAQIYAFTPRGSARS